MRLRRLDDVNREALPDCCAGGCGGSFNDFGGTCMWSAHLNWLALFCDAEGVEARSRGEVRRCPDFPTDGHWTTYTGYEPIACNKCYYACRGEAQAPLTISRFQDLLA